MRRAAALVCALLLGAPPAAAQFQPSARPRPEPRVLAVYGWSDYIDPAALEEFGRAEGVTVTYDPYETAAEFETRLLAGKSGYDLVIAPAGALGALIRAGRLAKLDRTKPPAAAGLAPEISARLAAHDPGGAYAVPYLYTVGGIAYDRAKVRARLGERAPQPQSWDVLFNPDLARRFADCGVELPDDAEAVFSAALAYLKINPASRAPADLRRAADTVARVRANIRRFTPPGAAGALGGPDICIAMTGGGLAFQAAAKSSAAIEFAVPREGAGLQLDTLAVPSDAPHPEAALRLIAFLQRPETAARNSAFTQAASAVAGVRALLPKTLAESAAVYPPPETLRRLYSPPAPDAAQQSLMAREWARAKGAK